jgi:hypothetical protein
LVPLRETPLAHAGILGNNSKRETNPIKNTENRNKLLFIIAASIIGLFIIGMVVNILLLVPSSRVSPLPASSPTATEASPIMAAATEAAPTAIPLPSYTDIINTYPAGAELSCTDAQLSEVSPDGGWSFTGGLVCPGRSQLTVSPGNTFTFGEDEPGSGEPLKKYGAKITIMETVTIKGKTYPAGSMLTVDKDLNWVQVASTANIAPASSAAGAIPTKSLTVAQIKVTHNPNPAKFLPGGASESAYTCAYKSSVMAIGTGVRIEKFGMYFWENNQWVHSTSNNGQPWSAQDFADWYSCPGSYIKAGQEYSDPNNWSGTDAPSLTKGKWYYAGVDDNGNDVQGEAVIECQP